MTVKVVVLEVGVGLVDLVVVMVDCGVKGGGCLL